MQASNTALFGESTGSRRPSPRSLSSSSSPLLSSLMSVLFLSVSIISLSVLLVSGRADASIISSPSHDDDAFTKKKKSIGATTTADEDTASSSRNYYRRHHPFLRNNKHIHTPPPPPAAAAAAASASSPATARPTQKEAPIMGILIEPPAWGTCVTFGNEGEDPIWKEGVASNANNKDDVTTPSTTNVPEPTLPPSGDFTGCVWSLYVKWLQSAGIRVVPVPWKSQTASDIAYLDWYLNRINGVLLPGGQLQMGTELFNQYFHTIQHIFNYTVERNTNHNDPFVFWGTCQGFEMVNAAAAATPEVLLRIYSGMKPLMMSANFTEFGRTSSAMFGVNKGSGDAPWGAPERIVEYIEKYPTTTNWHRKGIPPCLYSNPDTNTIPPCTNKSWIPASAPTTLGSLMVPIATTFDPTGEEFVAVAEGINGLKIFTVQFHPEKPVADFRRDAISHDHRSLAVSQYLALFLRDQLVLNDHQFDTPEQGNSLTMENYHYSQMGWGVQVYFI